MVNAGVFHAWALGERGASDAPPGFEGDENAETWRAAYEASRELSLLELEENGGDVGLLRFVLRAKVSENALHAGALAYCRNALAFLADEDADDSRRPRLAE